VSTPAKAQKTPSALQGASRFGHQAGARAAPVRRPRKTARWALGPEGLGPLGTWARARAIPQPCRAARRGDSPCWLALQPAGGLPSGPGPLRSGLPPAGERLSAAGASSTSLVAAGELLGFPHSAKKTSCFPHEINPVKSAIFFLGCPLNLGSFRAGSYFFRFP